jgi:chromosome segregation ATPase
MAAATVDQAVEDARREADEIVEEISAQAEARRDEATRVAAEAEAMAEHLLAEADQSLARIEEAETEAEMIKVIAREQADTLVSVERERVADEIEALAEVRNALETERGALGSYHEELRRRVQELV